MPGYIMHLTEARIIRRQIEQKIGSILPEAWWNLFCLGCLLPDSKKKGEKVTSHFWAAETLEDLAIAPDLELFAESYADMLQGPAMLGYWVHLHLDTCYVKEFWRDNFLFMNDRGEEERLRDRVVSVLDRMKGKTIDIKDFFTDYGYYGDYSRMNAYFSKTYQLQIPVYRKVEWEHFPVTEVETAELREQLEELNCLVKNEEVMADDRLQIFDRDILEEFVKRTALAAVDLILPKVRLEADRYHPYRRIDLHAHTSCSDGSLTPAQLVGLAARKKLDALAVTDHDTMAGVEEAMAEGERLGIEIIPGMEFSTMEEGHDVHMVGLFLDPENPELKSLMQTVVKRRHERNLKMVQRLINAGFNITWDDVKDMGDGIWTRGNLAQLLLDRGYGDSVTDCMNKYLSRGCVGYEPKVAISPEEAIQVVHQAGGLAFVAHFYQIDKKSLENSARICRKILAAGADGLETRYCRYDNEMRRMADEMAAEFDCLPSGGSDFHGKIKPGLELGDGYGDLVIPGEFLQNMKLRLNL